MEKIAIISDVHGNKTALDAALNDIEKRGIKRIFCLGDMLVKCSAPYECVETILSKCEVVIKGNCEDRAVESPRIDEHFWNGEKLSEQQKEYIKKLPLSYDFYISGFKVRLMHASPNSIHEKSFFWDFDSQYSDRMKIMFENSGYLNNLESDLPDIVIFGHIHKPMIIRQKDKVLINPGAISNSSDFINIGDKNYSYGSYLILEGDMDSKQISGISYKIVKFTYDHMQEALKIKNSDMPNKELASLEIETGKYFSRRALYHKGKEI